MSTGVPQSRPDTNPDQQGAHMKRAVAGLLITAAFLTGCGSSQSAGLHNMTTLAQSVQADYNSQNANNGSQISQIGCQRTSDNTASCAVTLLGGVTQVLNVTISADGKSFTAQ